MAYYSKNVGSGSTSLNLYQMDSAKFLTSGGDKYTTTTSGGTDTGFRSGSSVVYTRDLITCKIYTLSNESSSVYIVGHQDPELNIDTEGSASGSNVSTSIDALAGTTTAYNATAPKGKYWTSSNSYTKYGSFTTPYSGSPYTVSYDTGASYAANLTFSGSTSNYNTTMNIYNPNPFSVTAYYSSSKGTSGSWVGNLWGSKTTSSVTISSGATKSVVAYDVSGYNDTECGVYFDYNGMRFLTASTVGTSKTGSVGSNQSIRG